MSRLDRRGRKLLPFALAVVACHPGAGSDFVLTRLAAPAGAAATVRVGDEIRPAVVLAPNQAQTWSARSKPGSWLHFTLLGQGAPDQGFLELRVLANRNPVLERRFNLRRRTRSWPLAIPVNDDGAVELSVQVQLVDARGLGLAVPQARQPKIAIGAPRLYVSELRPRRRVLIWLSQDSLRADALGAYGYPRPTSVVFDRLAAEGVLFENAVAPSSWTLPSLASQFTSRYPAFHAAVGPGRLRDAAHPTLFSVLAEAGFTVLGVAGSRFVSDEFAMAAGFDVLWCNEGGAEELNRIALAALSEWRGGDLALFIHYRDPHFPYEPPPPHDRFDPGYAGSADGRNFERFGPEHVADVAHVRALYDGEVAYNDQQIGALLAGLGQRGLLQGALLAYSSDHGEEFLDHGGWTHSRTLYEEMLHVPLLLQLPHGPARRVAVPVSLVDLAPTILEAFEIAAPATFQGRSLLPLARGQNSEARLVFAETQHGLDRRYRVAAREGPLKYVLVMPPPPEPPRVLLEELFDLAADPRERRGLPASPTHTRLRAEALAFVERARAETRATGAPQLSPETIRELRALGYIE